MRSHSYDVYPQLTGSVKKSYRDIGKLNGISKSSVHRHSRSIQKRNLYPESHLWESKEGNDWLCLLYFGAILFFGVHCGIGAEKLSTFFKFLRLHNRIGTSPSTIKFYANKGCDLLDEYKQEQEKKSL